MQPIDPWWAPSTTGLDRATQLSSSCALLRVGMSRLVLDGSPADGIDAAGTSASGGAKPRTANFRISKKAVTHSLRHTGGETRARVKIPRRITGGPQRLYDVGHSRDALCSRACGLTRECSGSAPPKITGD